LDKKKRKTNIIKDSIPTCVLGAVFIFFTASVNALTKTGNPEWSLGFLLKMLLFSIPFGLLVGFLINITVVTARKYIKIPDKKTTAKESALVFALSLLLLLLSILPYFLAYYPGILAYDSYIQIEQIFSGNYNEHHPLIHTLLIRYSLLLGEKIFKEVNAGIAVYVIFQSILLSSVLAYGIYICNKRIGRIYSIILLLILMIFPFNPFMAVSVTKDTVFSAFFLLLILASFEYMINEQKGAGKMIHLILTGLAALGICVYRNNGRYALFFAIIICSFIMLFDHIKNRRSLNDKNARIVLITVFALTLAGMGLLSVASKSLGAVQGDRREMLSVPIQQLARTYVYHSGNDPALNGDDTLDDASKGLINEFFLYESADLYRPDISDPVKRNTNTWVVTNKTAEFIKVYTGLFFRYPSDYINAFLALNAGFIDITDETHAHINEIEGEVGLGYVQTRWEENSLTPKGFYKDSKWESFYEKADKWADGNDHLKIPVVKYIFMPGIYLWIYLFATVYAFKFKKKHGAFMLSLIGGYYLTMFFGPCVQLRYIYPVMISAPFILLMFVGVRNREEGNTDEE